MSDRRVRLLAACLAFVAVLGTVTLEADACSVPVFRYALDRWAPDAYRLEAPGAALAIEPLAANLRGDGSVRLNIQANALPDDVPGGTTTLRRPAEDGEADPLWTGELTAEAYRRLTESPVRTEIARRILAGETAVWVLVESGQPAADAAEAKLLDERLAAAEKAVTLPVIRPDDTTSRIGPGPSLRVKFSVLRVRRDAADEQVLIAMLAGPGGLAILPADAPFAAPVFGRGRVLGAWSPEKLTAELVGQATRFLVGACSCEAKELNPGWDLLMRVNWDAELEAVGAAAVATSGAAAPPAAAPEVVTYRPSALRSAADDTAGATGPNSPLLLAVLAGAALAVGAGLILLARRRT